MTKRQEIQALREEIAALSARVTSLELQVAQLGARATHHYHYPPAAAHPAPFSATWTPNICQAGSRS